MHTIRNLFLLAAVLATVSAASRRGQQPHSQPLKPLQTFYKPPVQPVSTQNASADLQQILSQAVAILVPKIQANMQVLMGNMIRAMTGAVVTSFKTGFKTHLTAVFVPLEKVADYNEVDVNDLDNLPPGHSRVEDGFSEEPSLQVQVSEEKLS